MSVITFSCTACGQVLQVGVDKAGRKAKCVQCGLVLTIPATAGAEVIAETAAPANDLGPGARPSDAPPRRRPRDDDEDDRDDDRPRRRRDQDISRSEASPWDKVRLGFLITFIGLCVMAGAYAVTLIGWLLVSFRQIDVGLIFVRIGAPFVFLGTIGALVGHVFWIFVSSRRGAKGFAIAATAVAGGYLVVQIVFLALIFGGRFGGHAVVNMLVALLVSAHFMMIAFYLRALGQMFEDGALERQAMFIIILAGAYGGYSLLTSIITMAVISSFSGGTATFVILELLHWIGRALLVVLYIFAIMAVYRGKERVDRA